MKLHFFKYEGAGNDFIVLDNRSQDIVLGEKEIRKLCDRHFGIGSDGLIFLTNGSMADFAMEFYNPDGSSGMMCGNGGRCIVRFAQDLGIIPKGKTEFLAPDGYHNAEILKDGDIALKMKDVQCLEKYADGIWLDTGTSHFVVKTDDVKQENIFEKGRALRYDARFEKHNGTNVNFYTELQEKELLIRTYERGVEDETLACGTGITATAIAYSKTKELPNGMHTISVKTLNDTLKVSFLKTEDTFTNVVLQGPAKKVYEGDVII